MKITPLKIPGIFLIKYKMYKDKRGYLFELYNKNKLLKNKLKFKCVQDNVVCSSRGVIRGLHYQVSPYRQRKIISVLEGEIFDVVVDFRKKSKTYLKWISIYLSSKNNKQVFIPIGFLHGYQVVSKRAIVHYKIDNEYSKKHGKVIQFNDKKLNICWPIKKTILSEKDVRGESIV